MFSIYLFNNYAFVLLNVYLENCFLRTKNTSYNTSNVSTTIAVQNIFKPIQNVYIG